MAHVHSTVGVDSSRQLLKWQQIMGDVLPRRYRGRPQARHPRHTGRTGAGSGQPDALRLRPAARAADGPISPAMAKTATCWSFPRPGRCTSSTRGATAMQAGGYVMVRSSEYYELSCADNFRNTTIRIPAQALESEYPRAWTHCPGAARPGRIRRRGPWFRAVGVAAERRVAPAARTGAGLRGGAAGGDPAARRGGRRRRGRRGGRRPARDGLAVPGDRQPDRGCDAETPLNAAQAQQLRISPGYVHRILARHATSFGEQLREAHLQQAYEMLADARLNHLTIKEVMYRAGFSNFSTSVMRSGSASAVPPASCASAGRARRLLTRSDARRSARRRTNKPCTPTTFPPGGVDILAASDFNPRGTR